MFSDQDLILNKQWDQNFLEVSAGVIAPFKIKAERHLTNLRGTVICRFSILNEHWSFCLEWFLKYSLSRATVLLQLANITEIVWSEFQELDEKIDTSVLLYSQEMVSLA